ncbi:YdcF family protein [Oecophyllibacter saccharovorans]|uniref:YdcF family protein n=1 Tax=Oecophyllibacter saccharovorans TaxID=2558360 RepID=A0A506URA9_9PROT|nr:YdcF family protein [Oecophyllibacter saccharovorans]
MKSPGNRQVRKKTGKRSLPKKTVSVKALLFWGAAGLCLLFGPLGFIGFTLDALQAPPARLPDHCPGMVALTGGEERVSAALRLLRAHPDHVLLISGVAPETTLDQIALQNGSSLPPGLERQITLGRRAVSTVGNGHETEQWAQENELDCIVVITAGYHMRRALLEIHQAARDLHLCPWRVLPPAMQAPWQPHALRILLQEYAKFLGAYARDTFSPPNHRRGLRRS